MNDAWKAARPEWMGLEELWSRCVGDDLAAWIEGDTGSGGREAVVRTAAMLEWAWRHDATLGLGAQSVCIEGGKNVWSLVGVATEAWPQRLIVLAMRQIVGADRAREVVAGLPEEVRAGWLDAWLSEVTP